MRKILLVDTNNAFVSDVESRLILDTIPDTDIVAARNFDNLSKDISAEKPTEILISARMIPFHPDWDFGLPLKCYAKNAEDMAVASEKRIPCIGIIKTAKELCHAVESNHTVEVVPVQKQEYQQKTMEEPSRTGESDFIDPFAPSASKNTGKQPQNTYGTMVENTTAFPQQPHYEHQKKDNYDSSSREKTGMENYEPSSVTGTANYEPSIETARKSHQTHNGTVENPDVHNTDIRSRLAAARAKEEEEEKKRTAALRNEQEMRAAETVERDMGNFRHPARVITVYSAKGGVGKTTISCELATFLALTNHGRGRFKVCIADFNIDFGDVLNTLSFDATRSCMTYWAADIQSRLDSGERPEEIQYTEAQISMYLQQNEKDGLYALIAPLTNEDSMDVTETQIQIMLDNLIQYGGFDFVVCDTGNNTRDCSIISLEKADEVLLVVTQDVNTANCNSSFLSTMRKVGFDMNKIRLVINKARPAKIVAISTEELEEAFVNPNTGKPYPCITRIKDNNEVKHANNLGEPLVYNSSHEFTRSIGIIAKEIIGDHFVLGEPEKKKGFFKKLFGKK